MKNIQKEIDTKELCKYLLWVNEKCNVCKHRYIERGYPDCKLNWDCSYNDYAIDIDKLKKEYPLAGWK